MTLRLEADAVFTVDNADTVFAPGAVEIEGGLISWVGDPWQEPPASGTDVRRLGGLLMPGLVNCHGHTPMALLRSAGDGLPLDRWLHESIWPREARLDDEDVYWGMLFGATEMLCNGMTTTCEQYRHPSAVVEAVVEAGIRTVYTPAIFDVPNAGPNNTWEALLDGRMSARRRRRRETRATPDGIRAACHLHGATGGRESHRRRSPSARRIAPDPSF